jgi:hypothetical protein
MIFGLTIETAFLGPTDTKGSRISATCKRDSNKTYRKTIAYEHAFTSEVNHHRAAEALMQAIDADTTYDGAEPFRIVARGYGGRSDAGYHFVINRGGA